MEVLSLKTDLPHQKAYQCIYGMVRSGELKPGKRIPPERNLVSTINVSRPTVSKAINQLVSEGILCRKEGRKGTFLSSSYAIAGRTNGTEKSNFHSEQSGFIKFVVPADWPKFPVRYGILEGMYSATSDLDIKTAIDYVDPRQDWFEKVLGGDKRKCMGLVFWGLPEYVSPACLELLEKRKIPVVFVDTHPEEDSCNFVISDNLYGAKQAVNYLVSKGHAKICYLTEQSSLSSMMDRKTGFVMGMLENKLRFSSDNIIEVQPDLSDLRVSLDAFFARKEIPTAIFVSHDKYVMSVFEYLYSKGLKCPDDVSIVGYDDIDISQFMAVPLTTVHQDFFQMGEIAAKVLLAASRESEGSEVPYHVFLKPTIVERNSVKTIK